MYLRANTGNKDAHYCKNNLLQVYGNSAVLIASIVALFLPGERAGRILLGALAVDLLIPYLGRATLKYLAPSFETDTYSERFGLFIIIVLGESVLGAVTGVEREQLSGINLTLIAGALMLSFVYRWLYFEYVSQATIIKKHILKRTYLHLPLTIFFTLISALIVYLIEYGQTIESRLPAILLILSCI
ncbi:MAG: low temperature requirement protein A [Candidatus Peribacteria bacterium]|nr:MAG: low temperature requirement protein A [Candidatus Peribacteria bacterium]